METQLTQIFTGHENNYDDTVLETSAPYSCFNSSRTSRGLHNGAERRLPGSKAIRVSTMDIYRAGVTVQVEISKSFPTIQVGRRSLLYRRGSCERSCR